MAGPMERQLHQEHVELRRDIQVDTIDLDPIGVDLGTGQ